MADADLEDPELSRILGKHSDLLDVPHRLTFRTPPPTLPEYNFHLPRLLLSAEDAPETDTASFFHRSPLQSLRDVLGSSADADDRRPPCPNFEEERLQELRRREERRRADMRDRECGLEWGVYMGGEDDEEDEGEGEVDATPSRKTASSSSPAKRKRRETEVYISSLSRADPHIRLMQRATEVWMAKRIVKKLKRMESDREHAAIELLETEKLYLSKMQTFQDLFSALRAPFPNIHEQIFGSDFGSMVKISEMIRDELQNVLFVDSVYQPFALLGKTLLAVCPLLRASKQYVARHDVSRQMIVNSKKTNASFARLLTTLEADPRAGATLGAYLIEPIQRIARYPLLLKAVIKKTSPEHPDYENLLACLEAMKQIAATVDRSVTDYERATAFRHLSTSFVDTPKNFSILSVAGRRLLGTIGAGGFYSTPEDLAQAKVDSKKRRRRKGGMVEDFTVLLDGIPVETDGSGGGRREGGGGGGGVVQRILRLNTKQPKIHVHFFSDSVVVSTPFCDERSGESEDGSGRKFRFKSQIPLGNVRVDGPRDPAYDRTFAIHDALRDLTEVISCDSRAARRKILRKVLDYIPDDGAHATAVIGEESGNATGGGSEKMGRLVDISPEGIAQAWPVLLSERESVQEAAHWKSPVLHLTEQSIIDRLVWLDPFRLCIVLGQGLIRGGGVSPMLSVDVSAITQLIISEQKSRAFSRHERAAGRLEGLSMTIGLTGSGISSINWIFDHQRDLTVWSRALRYLVERQKNTVVSAAEALADEETEPRERPMRYDVCTWGRNQCNALGHGMTDFESNLPKVLRKFLLHDIRDVEVGEDCAFVVLRNGLTFAWGKGDCGRLGHGNATDCRSPLMIRGLRDVEILRVRCGKFHTLFLDTSGRVWGCGGCEFGQLGIDRECEYIETPTKLPYFSATAARLIAAGGHHSAAVSRDNVLYVWGRGADGQLGLGDLDARASPTAVCVGANEDVGAVALGLWHTLAVTLSGRCYAWGNGADGQLGTGQDGKGLRQCTPVRVEIPDERIRLVGCGAQHSVAVTKGGDIYTWGSGNLSQHGHPTFERITVPTKIATLGGRCVGINCGTYHTLARVIRTEDVETGAFGEESTRSVQRLGVVAWGYGTAGRLGIGDSSDQLQPTAVPYFDGKHVVRVVAGPAMSAAIFRHIEVDPEERIICMDCDREVRKGGWGFSRKSFHCQQCGGVFCKLCTIKIPFTRVGERILVQGHVCKVCQRILETWRSRREQ